jgi:hypothetical protein
MDPKLSEVVTLYRECEWHWDGGQFPAGRMRIVCDRRAGIVIFEVQVRHGDTQVNTAWMMPREALIAKLAECGVLP